MSDKLKIAFQGEKGAYSHLACLELFPNAEVMACSTFEKTFQKFDFLIFAKIPI